MLNKSLLLATASSLLLATHSKAEKEHGIKMEQRPFDPEPLAPGCSNEISMVLPDACLGEREFVIPIMDGPILSKADYLRKLHDACVADMKPLLLHVPEGWYDEATTFAQKQGPGAIEVGIDWGMASVAKQKYLHHSQSRLNRTKPVITQKARKAARRRAKQGRRNSR